jgi:YVTN family beta-propeller protein/YD repeat-containing protein
LIGRRLRFSVSGTVRPSVRRLAIVVLVIGACLGDRAVADVVYLYDDIGRLARVIKDNGQAATYEYDAVGNILRITRDSGVPQTSTAATISVTNVVRGSCTATTIAGTNLIGASLASPVSGITFDNIHSTLGGLTFDLCVADTAPTGATTIDVVGLTTSSVPLTVAQEPPVITGFSPTSGAAGDTVTISGHGFDAVPAGNTVRFNGTPASVTSATPTSLATRVPDGAQTGPISVTTAGGTATSTQAFTVTAGIPRLLAQLNPPFLFPTDMVISADGSRAYVVNQSRNNVSVIDTATHSIVATLPAGTLATFAVITPDGSRLYVLNRTAISLSVFDTVNNQPLTTIPLLAASVSTMAMTPDGRNVLITHPSNNTVSLVDTTTNTVAALIPVGPQPFRIFASPDNRRVHVHNSQTNTLSVIDVPSRSVVATIDTGPSTGFPAFGVFNADGSRYYSDTQGNRVIVTDTATNTVTSITGFGSTRAGVLSPDESRLYVGDLSIAPPQSQSGIVVVDTTTSAIVTKVAIGSGPSSIALTPDGRRLVAINRDDNTTTVFDAVTNSVTTVVPSNGAMPILVRSLPGNRLAYVLNRDSGTMSVIDVVANAAVDAPIAKTVPNDFLVLTPDGQKLFGAAGSLTDRVVAGLDTRDNHVLPNTTIPRSPQRSAPAINWIAVDPVTGGSLYADNSRSPLWIVDTATNLVVGSIPKTVLVTFGIPSMFFNATGSRLLVFGSGGLSFLDTVNRTELSVTSVPGFGAVSHPARTAIYLRGTNVVRVLDPNTTTIVTDITVGLSPGVLAITGDGGRLVAVSASATTIAVVDPATNSLVASVPAGGVAYSDVVASPNAQKAFLVSAASKRIDVLDLATNAITSGVSLAAAPNFVVASRDGKWVFTVQTQARIITVIDAATAAIATTITIPSGPSNNGLRRPIAAPNGRLYVPDADFNALFVIE